MSLEIWYHCPNSLKQTFRGVKCYSDSSSVSSHWTLHFLSFLHTLVMGLGSREGDNDMDREWVWQWSEGLGQSWWVESWSLGQGMDHVSCRHHAMGGMERFLPPLSSLSRRIVSLLQWYRGWWEWSHWRCLPHTKYKIRAGRPQPNMTDSSFYRQTTYLFLGDRMWQKTSQHCGILTYGNLRTPVGYLIDNEVPISPNLQRRGTSSLLGGEKVDKPWSVPSICPVGAQNSTWLFRTPVWETVPPLAVCCLVLWTERARVFYIGHTTGKIATSRLETPVGHHYGLKHGGFPL